jgi:DNA-binding response OmpR family regulator
MRVLLVEDEEMIGMEIREYLNGESLLCDWSRSYGDASEQIFVNEYDFILLDLGLPDGDGLDLLKEIKQNSPNSLIIILTARSNVSDRVQGLELGADDYLAKPFSFLELKARMQAILRRKAGWINNIIKIGNFSIDVEARQVRFLEQPIELTHKEFGVLHFLFIHCNKVINRYQIAEHLWGDHLEEAYQSNFIDVHIKNIRKKLGAFEPIHWLETVRGVGYKINTG